MLTFKGKKTHKKSNLYGCVWLARVSYSQKTKFTTEKNFHVDKKVKTCWPPRSEGWISLYFLERLTCPFDMTPTMAKHHWSIWQKAVFVFLRRKKTGQGQSDWQTHLFSVHILHFGFRVRLHVLGWMRTLQSNDFCVSRVPPPLSTVLLITSTPIVCCIDLPKASTGCF